MIYWNYFSTNPPIKDYDGLLVFRENMGIDIVKFKAGKFLYLRMDSLMNFEWIELPGIYLAWSEINKPELPGINHD